MAPTIFPFGIEIEPMAGMLHRRNTIPGPYQLRDDTLNQRGLAAV
jgi:hypothetical protein